MWRRELGSPRAFHRYRSSLDSLRPIEERVVDNPLIPYNGCNSKVAGGVYVTIKESVRLFTMGSASRGIAPGVWEITLPCIVAG